MSTKDDDLKSGASSNVIDIATNPKAVLPKAPEMTPEFKEALKQAAAYRRFMFEAYKSHGFTDAQALELCTK